MNNPFTSQLFTTTWLKHFKGLKSEISFDFLNDVEFYKSKYFKLYINIGKNLTKGIFYSINHDKSDYRNKVFLIYDVPTYFNVESINTEKTNLKLKRNFQYKGFALDFKDFNTSEEYVASRVSAKNRRGYRSRLKRLEECFDISYSYLYGKVDRQVYDVLFKQFHELLSQRFSEKRVDYHHLHEDKWAFYTELVFEMLNQKKASLFTIYDNKKPIGITLNFHSDDIAFVTITVFDPNYYKFNVGKASIVKLLEWCYEQDIRIMDLSKGEFDFKYEWCNLVYDFDYHILYDSKSISASMVAYAVDSFYKTKLYLRKKKVNNLYRKWVHKLSPHPKNNQKSKKIDFEYITDFNSASNYELLNLDIESNQFLKKFLYSFLFANPQPVKEVNVYDDNSNSHVTYIIEGKSKTQKISFL